jgi:regulatory protein YycH of two-component signal transduction system YycFG
MNPGFPGKIEMGSMKKDRTKTVERIKTWVLTILVGLSIVFTGYLWFGFERVFSPLAMREAERTALGSQRNRPGVTQETGSETGNGTSGDLSWRLWAGGEPGAEGSSWDNEGPGGAKTPGSDLSDTDLGSGLTYQKALSPFQVVVRANGDRQYLLTYGSEAFDKVYRDGSFFKDIGLECPSPIKPLSTEKSGGEEEEGAGFTLSEGELKAVRQVPGVELIFMRPVPLDSFFSTLGYDLPDPEPLSVRRILIAEEPEDTASLLSERSKEEETRSDTPRAKGEDKETEDTRKVSSDSASAGDQDKREIGVWAEVWPKGEYLRLPMRVNGVRLKRVFKHDLPSSLLAQEVSLDKDHAAETGGGGEGLRLTVVPGVYAPIMYPRLGPITITWDSPSSDTLEDMLRSFFIDTSVLRQIEERDGAVIYTDGRKGLRVYSYSRIEYTAPQQAAMPASSDPLGLSLEYVREHGGWLPNSLLWDYRKEAAGGAVGDRLGFTATLETMPVFFGPRPDPLIEVVVNGDAVSWYERRIPSPEDEPRRKMGVIAAREALRSVLRYWEQTGSEDPSVSDQKAEVVGLHLGYFGLSDGESSQYLYPSWFIHFKDMETIAVNANTGMVFEPVE